VLKRVLGTLGRVAAAHHGRRVLAITHSDAIRTIEHAIGADLPPVPHLEGRWLRVDAPHSHDGEPDIDSIAAGELTTGRRELVELARSAEER
jgi:broad specificity phosphatase PhoE